MNAPTGTTALATRRRLSAWGHARWEPLSLPEDPRAWFELPLNVPAAGHGEAAYGLGVARSCV
ncbi:hypothetical protein GCM10028784_29680 [Myceligenerans cantabricum]